MESRGRPDYWKRSKQPTCCFRFLKKAPTRLVQSYLHQGWPFLPKTLFLNTTESTRKFLTLLAGERKDADIPHIWRWDKQGFTSYSWYPHLLPCIEKFIDGKHILAQLGFRPMHNRSSPKCWSTKYAQHLESSLKVQNNIWSGLTLPMKWESPDPLPWSWFWTPIPDVVQLQAFPPSPPLEVDGEEREYGAKVNFLAAKGNLSGMDLSAWKFVSSYAKDSGERRPPLELCKPLSVFIAAYLLFTYSCNKIPN